MYSLGSAKGQGPLVDSNKHWVIFDRRKLERGSLWAMQLSEKLSSLCFCNRLRAWRGQEQGGAGVNTERKPLAVFYIENCNEIAVA